MTWSLIAWASETAIMIITNKQGHLGPSTRLTIAGIRALQWKL